MAIINAVSASQTDVASAIASASAGDIVQVPAGNVTWTSTVTISKSLSLIGAGSANTIIARTSGSSYNILQLSNFTADVPLRVSGFTFNNINVNPGFDCSAIAIAPTTVTRDTGVNQTFSLTKARIDHCVFNYGQSQIIVYDTAYPCIDHNTFYNCDMGVQIWCDNDFSWQRPIATGTKNAVFIEDNTFTIDNNILSFPFDAFCILHTQGSRSVIRHNTMDAHAYTIDSNIQMIDGHGSQKYYSGSTTNDFRATILVEVYNNTMHTHQSFKWADMRGGSWLVHDNQFTADIGVPVWRMRDEEDDTSSGKFAVYRWPSNNPPAPANYDLASWPCEDQINNTFFWNNTWVGGSTGNRNQLDTDYTTFYANDPFFIQQNRDYWTKAPDSTTVTTYPQPTVPPSSSSYPTVYASITSYTPYTYPHPLTITDTTPPTAPGGLSIGSPTSSSLTLSWTAATDPDDPSANLVYLLEHKGGSIINFTQFAATASGATTFTDSGLSSSTAYTYQIRAQDPANNLGPYSTQASGTTLAPDTSAPTIPTGLSVGSPTVNSLTLTWTSSTDVDNPSSSLIYTLQRQSGGSGPFVTASSSIPDSGTGTVTYVDSGLSPVTLYAYQLSARDPAGNPSAFSSPTSPISTLAPAPALVQLAKTEISSGTGTPAFVQGNSSTPTGSQTSVSATFTSAQVAGNMNVVVIGRNDTTSGVSTVTDTLGNTYNVAAPVVRGTALSQSIFYASFINPGTNTVTVTFSPAASIVDLRIAEYSNASTLDVIASGFGTGLTAATSSLTTTQTSDVVVAAVITSTGVTGPQAGSGFTQRILTTDGDNLEDNIPGALVTTTAPVTLSSSGNWINQAAAFYKPTSSATVSATFGSAQSASNTNIVTVLLMGDIVTNVSSVTDTSGNVYTLASGPTRISTPSALSQWTYYCSSIASSGSNTVTASFSASVGTGRAIYATEYVGLMTISPLDGTPVAASGSGTSASSGILATT